MRCLMLLALVGCTAAVSAAATAKDAFERWAEKLGAEWVRINPQLATRTQYFDGPEQDALDRKLAVVNLYGSPYGRTMMLRYADLARRGLAELKELPAHDLPPDVRTSANIIRSTLEQYAKLGEFPDHAWVFDHIAGFHLSIVQFLTTTHPIRNERDAENYLARLSDAGPRLDDALADAEAAAKEGLLPPRFILERVLGQLDGLASAPPEESALVTTFARRLEGLGDAIPAGRRDSLVSLATEEMRRTVIPAYRRVRAALTEHRDRATDDAGVWRLPRGAEYYAACLEYYTDTKKTAEEIHAIGLREVVRIEAEMDEILVGLGYRDGAVMERYKLLCESMVRPDTDEARADLLAEVRAAVRDAERRAESDFDLRPLAPVEVRRELSHAEKSTPARYSPPAPDGSSPGVYWIPLADISPTLPWLGPALKTTAYHETVPGHHFQFALQLEIKELPRYRSTGVFGWSDAYGEGWGLYAERLAAEKGWYEGDPVGRLGYLRLQLYRALRLVVDTGIHVKRWTPERVVEYGFPVGEAERYVVWPGQACSYMIGQLRIIELREQARAALGEGFSIKEFHNVVLRGGSMPLDVLTQEVEAWIASLR